ncbi:hypothetical protein QJ850_gp106 [Acanthamoeba polyphaga mimivirus]|uniref:Ankyrin repeat protein n=1 Tax=Acanthamoeba polyphaga mimivirus Kroon TaxID=3069720 RepID=A0A0G2Y465_9VIRU|nr:hypothetical protein QJ850_gp106 [Acanthamoeba polyphaga mimivirus]AKI80593.1 hypothetical protein [Acanthamoeba polyphaga mimivirus Kroon]
MESFKFKLCLCGNNCLSERHFSKYCVYTDDQQYFYTHKRLIPISIIEIKKNVREYLTDVKYVEIDINDIVDFFEYDIKNNYHTIFHDSSTLIGTNCCHYSSCIETIKYIAKNNIIDLSIFIIENSKYFYYNIIFSGICSFSNLNVVKSIIKYIPISLLQNRLNHGFIHSNNEVVEYLLKTYMKYLKCILLKKKIKGTMFYLDSPETVFLKLQSSLKYLLKSKYQKKTMKIYEYIINQFSQLENDLIEIDIDNDMIEMRNEIISKLQYSNKIATSLLNDSLSYKQDDNLSFTRQLILDGGNLNDIRDYTINLIIKNKNINLLDLMYDEKLVYQNDLNHILMNSSKTDPEFIQELINYGADIDKYHEQLLKNTKNSNTKLNSFLKNYYNNSE